MITWRIFKKVMAAMVVVIGLGMGSCVDNIDNSTTPSEKEQQEQQAAEAQQAKAQKFWAVVSHLVDVDDYTDDYENMTFEPAYGVEGAEAGTRYIYTNDAATAAERFGDLVDCNDIDENTPSYTYDDPDVGKLVYTKGSGRFLATVDVDIKQIPNLKKIVYMPGAYVNGFFQGRAYYRFGDVVRRRVVVYGENNAEEQVNEYWICVRPSFGPEKKGDSHWVCLNVLPKKNTWYYKASNYNEYWLPTGIGINEEHMQNLAEMLYAIYNPQKWYQNVTNETYSKLRMFHDFSKSRANLHNDKFWQSVQNAWRNYDITEKVMNLDSITTRQIFTETIENPNPSLHLLYKGYSWYKSISWNCSLFEATFTAGNDNKERNMHKADYQERTENVQEFGMDYREMGFLDAGYGRFFHNDQIYRWTVRHATGKELARNGRYNEQEPIDGAVEVYRYYRDVNTVAIKDLPITEPEVTDVVETFGDDEPDDEP